MFFSFLGIIILLAKPFPAEINDSLAFIVFDIGWLVTLVRIIIFIVRPSPFLTALWRNWRELSKERIRPVARLQKAFGMSVMIEVGKSRVTSLLFKSFGISVNNGKITLDDVFAIKKKLPLKEFNEHFPDLLSVARHYAFQFRWLLFSTAGVFVVTSVFIGLLLRHFVIASTTDTTLLQRFFLALF